MAERGAWRGTGGAEADPKGLAGCRGITEALGGFGTTELSRGSCEQVWGRWMRAHGDGSVQRPWAPRGSCRAWRGRTEPLSLCRRRAGRSRVARAAVWRSWLTDPTAMAPGAAVSTPTRSTTLAPTSPAGSGHCSPKLRSRWRRSPGMLIRTHEPGWSWRQQGGLQDRPCPWAQSVPLQVHVSFRGEVFH